MSANAFQENYLRNLAQQPYMRAVLQPGRTVAYLETYTYNVVIGTAARPLSFANGAVTANLITQADSDFVFDMASGCVNLVANGDMQFARNLTLQIQDQSSGKFFFSAPTVMSLVLGAGGFPFVFPAPRVLRPNSSIQFTAQDREPGTDFFQMFVALHGTRIFYN